MHEHFIQFKNFHEFYSRGQNVLIPPNRYTTYFDIPQPNIQKKFYKTSGY